MHKITYPVKLDSVNDIRKVVRLGCGFSFDKRKKKKKKKKRVKKDSRLQGLYLWIFILYKVASSLVRPRSWRLTSKLVYAIYIVVAKSFKEMCLIF